MVQTDPDGFHASIPLDIPTPTMTSTDSPVLIHEKSEGVVTLTLNRPEKRNAINNAMARSLLSALAQADAQDDVRAVLLRGNGLAFCAGRDVSEPPTEEDLELTQQVARAIVQCRKPVVAAVHGWVVGAGLEWMLDADVVIAADTARFKLPEASLGVFVTGGISAVLPAIAGLSRAKAMMLLGEPFSAQQALDWGIVWRVVPQSSLAQQSMDCAQQLAALSPSVAAHFKRVINGLGLPEFERAIQMESDAQRALMALTNGAQ
jgi:2-(1,2-epoxy-1,2-dihydrophenyl)acetyl-CoA isomerase